MWVLTLVLLAQRGQAYDGCGLAQQWRCGDVCISEDAPCHCGGETLSLKESTNKTHSAWCCTNTPCAGLGRKGANCSTGTALNLTQPCPSHFLSTKNTTKQTREALGGAATVRCNNYNVEDEGLRSYVPCWEPNQKITKCIKKSQMRDGKYDCQSRSDERPFSKRNQKFDLTGLLSECHDNSNRTGLMCGKECLRFDNWCQQKPAPIKCAFPGHEPFFSDDKDICSHPTFWRDKECTEHRCTGFFPGQCRHTVSVLGMMY